jgi:ribosomal protein S19E (S16A)
MENPTDLRLSPSEKRTLQHLVEGELHTTELDWVALQRLKRLALVEQRNAGWGITKEGRRQLRRLSTPA